MAPTHRHQHLQQVFRFALRPSAAQNRALASHAGGARYAYNWGITQIRDALAQRRAEQDAKIAAHRKNHPDDDPDELRKTIKGDTPIPGHFDLCKRWTAYKDTHADTTPQQRAQGVPYTGWVGNNAVSTYQSALRNAHVAWSNTIKSATGRRAGARVRAPRYKSRKNNQSFTLNGNITLPGQHLQQPSRNQTSHYRHIKLPTIGTIPTAESTKKLASLLRQGNVDCTQCDGHGYTSDAPTCKPCDGTGNRAPATCKKCDGTGTTDTNTACPDCDSTGQRPVRCRTCKGHGRTKCSNCLGEGNLPNCRIVSVTCTREPGGRWHISIVVARIKKIRITPSKRQRRGGPVGVDIGQRGYTLSTGHVLEAPHPLKDAEDRLAKLGRDLARKTKGSKRRDAARLRLARAHGRIAAVRRDYNSKLVTDLIRSHTHVAVEGWSITKIIAEADKHSNLPKRVIAQRRKSLLDIGAGQLRQMLSTRAPWWGAETMITSDYEHTARTCSRCGVVKTKPVPLTNNHFDCDSCGARLDRRVNAATVTLALAEAPGGGDSINARGGDVSTRSPVASGQSPMKREALTDADGKPTGRPESGKKSTGPSRGGPFQPTLWAEN